MELLFFLLMLFASVVALGYGYERNNPVVFYFGAGLLVITGLFVAGFGLDKQVGVTQVCNGVGCSLSNAASITTNYDYNVLTTENNSFVWSLSLILPALGLVALVYYTWVAVRRKKSVSIYEEDY